MSNDVSIKSFIAKLGTGLAKPCRYRVEFNLPAGFNADNASSLLGMNISSSAALIRAVETNLNQNGLINVLCHTCSLPQRSLLTYEHKQLSAPYRVPYSQTYDPVTFSFYADSEYIVREYFDIWQNAVVNIGSNTLNYYNEFTSDVKIYAIDDAGEDTYSVILYEAYPINIGIVDLSYSNMNATQTVTVTLSYKYWASHYNTTAVNRTQ
jgi:hypothetical protein